MTTKIKTFFRIIFGIGLAKKWTCDICGGDSSTGCQYYDPSECPRSGGGGAYEDDY